MRDALNQALYCLADGPLRERAERLFNVLGYRSDRTADVGGVAGFIAWLDQGGKPLSGRQRRLFDDWTGAEIVFQLTSDEIGDQAQRLFEGAPLDYGQHRSFLFVAADLRPAAYTRTQFADMARAVNRGVRMPVILLFRHGETITLAVVHRRAHKYDSKRDILENVVLIKDIRCKAPHRAHLDILTDLALDPLTEERGVSNFDSLHAAWERILDIEALNRKFYRELFAWFERAVRECRFPEDGAGAGSTERHVIRMTTRILFIWFLAEKNLVPRNLFDEETVRVMLKSYNQNDTDYYRAVLQNLFFATLNTEIDRRAFSRKGHATHRDFGLYRYRDRLADPDAFVEHLRSVPFINGGLFDCLDDFEGQKEGGRRIDAFTDVATQGRELNVPARLFFNSKGLFPLIKGYKFTVEENTPLDREVALDPELLGRVFENLLAAYNPETYETARRATGSYYTPRHIVDYMVGEALVAALSDKARPTDADDDFWRERLRYLLDWESAFDDAGDLFDENETDAIVRAIAHLRVLDPAVGSGAFPMGVLHKLTLALRRLDRHNRIWETIQREIAAGKAGAAFKGAERVARDERLLEISRIFEAYRDSDFGRKLYLIQNSIFGVDIQPVACQIAKLRFFISLAIEQESTVVSADNYGIRPLPNLETRFVAADTLIRLSDDDPCVLGSDVVERKKAELREIRESYFNEVDRGRKRKLRMIDREKRADLAHTLEEDLGYGHDNAEAISSWDPYDQNARSGWFHPEWMFNAASGFDLVIGNPPYIKGGKIPDKTKLRVEYGSYYAGNADIYTYFFRRGIDLLCDNGILCFITSNKFMRAEYGRNLRTFLKREAPPLAFVDLGRTGTFDATVRPAILLARKRNPDTTMRAATVRGSTMDGNLINYVNANGFAMPHEALADTVWSLATPDQLGVRKKIQLAGVPLQEYLAGEIHRGIGTGLNAAFVVDADTRKRLIDRHADSEQLIKPWINGKNIRRWRIDWDGSYVIFPYQGVNIDAYPAIKRHLSRFRKDLEPKLSSRDKRGRAPGSYRWFEYQSPAAYRESFRDPKVVYSDISPHMRATLDRRGYVISNTCYMLPGDDKYLLAILNSRLLDFYFRLAMPCLDDPFDGGHMRFVRGHMKNAPIAKATPRTATQLAEIANRIQTARESGSGAPIVRWQAELDRLVYAQYNLNDQDVSIVENATVPGT